MWGGASIIAALFCLCGCSRTEAAWQQAVHTDTPDSYELFLKRSPGSEHAADARIRRDALIDERDWQVARSANSVAAYAAYFTAHPNGVWAELAVRRRDQSSVQPVVPEQPADAAVDPDAPAATPTPVEQAPRHFVQLGAYSSGNLANQSWERMQGSHAELRGLEPVIVQVPGPASASLYRLRIAIPSREGAERLCAALVRAGADCLLAPEE